jgi:cell division transport system permease protein
VAEAKYSRLRLRSSSVTTIVSLSLVLFMLGLLGLVILNTKKIGDHFKENIGFQLIISDAARDIDISRLQTNLNASTYVKSTQFISKEEAAKTLQKDLGEDFVSFIGYNPLKSSIDVRLKADFTNPDSLGWIETQLMQNKIVKEVLYPKALVSSMNANMKKAAFFILAFSAILLIIALALINNTIRLSIYSKRFIIKTMQLVGATQGFIRLPFILKGIRQGIYSAIIAILMLLGILYFAQKEVPELMVVQDIQVLGIVFGIVFLLGITIGGISTALAVGKYLRLRTNELYN